MDAQEDVKRLAKLARLDIPEDKLAAFAAGFGSILKYVGQLDSLSLAVDGTPATPALRNVFRLDENPTEPGTNTEKLAKAFPKREGDALSVKQIISHD